MKKIFTLIFTLVLVCSCDVQGSRELTVNTGFLETIAITIPETSGTAVSYDETVTQDLEQLISNHEDVVSININSLRYRYNTTSSNTAAVIENASIVVNGVRIALVEDINIVEESNLGTVFSITDESVLNQLEEIFINDPLVTIQFTGSALSDDGPIDFEIIVLTDLTAIF